MAEMTRSKRLTAKTTHQISKGGIDPQSLPKTWIKKTTVGPIDHLYFERPCTILIQIQCLQPREGMWLSIEV